MSLTTGFWDILTLTNVELVLLRVEEHGQGSTPVKSLVEGRNYVLVMAVRHTGYSAPELRFENVHLAVLENHVGWLNFFRDESYSEILPLHPTGKPISYHNTGEFGPNDRMEIRAYFRTIRPLTWTSRLKFNCGVYGRLIPEGRRWADYKVGQSSAPIIT